MSEVRLATVSFDQLPKVDGLIGPLDLTSEAYREYVQAANPHEAYRINNPVALYRREGGTTHRVVDESGLVHCVPCGALHPNTIIRWRNKDITNPVNW